MGKHRFPEGKALLCRMVCIDTKKKRTLLAESLLYSCFSVFFILVFLFLRGIRKAGRPSSRCSGILELRSERAEEWACRKLELRQELRRPHVLPSMHGYC